MVMDLNNKMIPFSACHYSKLRSDAITQIFTRKFKMLVGHYGRKKILALLGGIFHPC